MTFYAAVLAYAFYKTADYAIKRRQGFHGPMPVGSSALGLWAGWLLVG